MKGKTKPINFFKSLLLFELWNAYKEDYEKRNGTMTENQERAMKNAFFNGANFMLQTIDFASETYNAGVIATIADNAADAFKVYCEEMEAYNATRQ